MNTASNRGKSVSSLFVYVLIGLFALVCIMAVLLGATVYRSVTQKQQAHTTERVLTAYVRSMVRTHAEAGAVSVEKGENGDILLLTEKVGNETLITRLYCYDGKLTEHYTYLEDPFEPESGEAVCDAKSLSVETGEGVLYICVTGADGTGHHVTVAVPGAGEGGAE